MANPGAIRDFNDLMDRIVQAARARTGENAKSMATAIDKELMTEETTPIESMSVNDVAYLVAGIAERNVPGNATVPPVNTRDMADSIETDLMERTANALSAKSGKPPEAVMQSIKDGLRDGGAGSFGTQEIAVTIPAIVTAAQGQDDTLPNLDDQEKNKIVADVVGDVREQTAITLANEMVPPAGRIPGGYPLAK